MHDCAILFRTYAHSNDLISSNSNILSVIACNHISFQSTTSKRVKFSRFIFGIQNNCFLFWYFHLIIISSLFLLEALSTSEYACIRFVFRYNHFHVIFLCCHQWRRLMLNLCCVCVNEFLVPCSMFKHLPNGVMDCRNSASNQAIEYAKRKRERKKLMNQCETYNFYECVYAIHIKLLMIYLMKYLKYIGNGSTCVRNCTNIEYMYVIPVST